MNAVPSPADVDPLQKTYRDNLARYERGAERWKRGSQVLFSISVLTTVALSFVGIVGTIIQAGGSAVPRVWMTLPAILGAIGVACILFDLVVDPRMRWMTYRRAVHQLWRLAAFGRTGLGAAGEPLEHGSAAWVESLDGGMKNIAEEVETAKTSWLECDSEKTRARPLAVLQELFTRLQHDWSLPEPPAGHAAQPHFPEAGPRPQIETADAYLAGRVVPQIEWFLKKAALNRSRYLLLTGLVAVIYGTVGAYCIVRGRVFWVSVACSTIVMAINMLLAFLNCRPLWEQYRDAARELLAVERRFRDQGGDRGETPATDTERFRRLVNEVEDILESEFYFWHAIHEQARPAALMRRVTPQADGEHA